MKKTRINNYSFYQKNLCKNISTKSSFSSTYSSAFTIAETLIALTILGIIAALTIPQAVRRQIEVQKRTKLKKAMAIYDHFIMKMVTENDIKSASDLSNWADSKNRNDCNNTISYFKTVERDKCTFKTSDGLYWNVDNILNPSIATTKEDLEDYINGNKTNKNAFSFVTSFDAKSGAFRINDTGFETSLPFMERDDNKIDDLDKVYKNINPEFKENDLFNYMKNLHPQSCEGQERSNMTCSLSLDDGVRVYENGKEIGSYIINTSTGKKAGAREILPDGTMNDIYWYDNGQISYKASTKDGIQSGIAYYESGKKQYEAYGDPNTDFCIKFYNDNANNTYSHSEGNLCN